MVKAHSKRVQTIYDLVAENYASGASFFRTVARQLILSLPVTGGRVLDVGCGRGAVADQLAGRADLEVYATDLSLQMLRANQAAAGGVWTQRQANAVGEALPFADGVFDAVLCSQALPFFSDPAEGLREFVRVARSGGSVAVSTNGRPDARLGWYLTLLRDIPQGPPLVTHPLAGTKALRAAFESTGLGGVTVARKRIRTLFSTPDDFWSFCLSTGLRASLDQLGDAQLSSFRRRVEAGFPALREGDDHCVYYDVYIATGTAP